MSFVPIPARLAAVGALVALTMAGTPNAASADPIDELTGPVGQVQPVAETVSTVVLKKDGETAEYPAQLLKMKRGDTVVPGYSLNPDKAARRAADFTDSIAPSDLDAGKLRKIDWILTNAPAVAAAPAGVPAVPGVVPGVSGSDTGPTPAEAVAATQAAIWHYSAGTEMVRGRNSDDVESLYRRLTGDANPGITLPSRTLISADDDDAFGDVRGTAGELVGPFRVDPAVDSVRMTLDGPAGVRLVDDTRRPLSTFRGGQRFYLDVPESAGAGRAVITAIGGATSALGRVLRGITKGDPGQLLLVADRRRLPGRQSSVARWSAGGFGRGVGIAPTCVPGGIGVEIDNARRNKPLRLTVDGWSVSVRPGSTKIVPVRVPEGDRYNIRVSDGRNTTHLRGERHCASPPPAVAVAPDCTDDGMDVTIVNDDAARDAVMSVNGESVRVASKSTKTVDVPVEGASGEYSIRVMGRNGFSRTFNGVRTCDPEPAQGAAEEPAAAPAPAPALPVTGAALGGIVVGGAFLLGAGALVLLVTRRNRRGRLRL